MSNVFKKLHAMLDEPLYQHLISPTAIAKLRNVMSQPYTPNAPGRLKQNNLSSYFANLSKAYHSGKGDDFESVAVVFGNPALPISLSDAGLVSDKEGQVTFYDEETNKQITMKTNPELWKAMKTYGGHYITVNLNTTGVKMPQALTKGGKGKSRVQLDYLILIPGKPYKVYIIELKAGKGHLRMDEKEEEQMLKAKYTFKELLGKDTEVNLMYCPFLADDLSFAKNYSSYHQSVNVTYITLNGLVKFLKLNSRLATNLGGLRHNYRANAALLESHLSRYMKNVEKQLREKITMSAAEEAIEDELEKVIMKSNLLSKNVPSVLAARGTSIKEVFRGKLALPLINSDAAWKPALQKILYFLLQRDELQNKLKTNKNTRQTITELYKISQQILKHNQNHGGRILKQAARNDLAKFVANTKNVFVNAKNSSSDIVENYLLHYIEIRAKRLGANKTTLANVPNSSKKRLPDPAETAAGMKLMTERLKPKKGVNANFLNQMRAIKNATLTPGNRGLQLRNLTTAIERKYNPNITQVQLNTSSSRTTQNVNLAKTTLNAHHKKLDEIINFLKTIQVGNKYPGVPKNKHDYATSRLRALISRIDTVDTDIQAKLAAMRGQLTPTQVRQANQLANVTLNNFKLPNNMGTANMFAGPPTKRPNAPVGNAAPSAKRMRVPSRKFK
jgi:hypothetical protein